METHLPLPPEYWDQGHLVTVPKMNSFELLLILCGFHVTYLELTYLCPLEPALPDPEIKTKFKRKTKNRTKETKTKRRILS